MSDEILDHATVVENTEKALDVIEDQLDNLVETVEVVRNNPVLLAASVVGGAALGAGVAYLVLRKLHAKAIDEREVEITEEARAFYKHHYESLYKIQSPMAMYIEQHPQEALAGLEALEEYQGLPQQTEAEAKEERDLLAKAEERARRAALGPKVKGETVTKMVFEARTPVFSDPEEYDYAVEVELRRPDEPYIITKSEYDINEVDFDQGVAFTFYRGDGVLTDETDSEVHDTDRLIGDDNLTRIGAGSEDENILYVRNESVRIDYMIVKSDGKFTEEVMAFDEPDSSTLQHGQSRGVSKREQRAAWRNDT